MFLVSLSMRRTLLRRIIDKAIAFAAPLYSWVTTPLTLAHPFELRFTELPIARAKDMFLKVSPMGNKNAPQSYAVTLAFRSSPSYVTPNARRRLNVQQIGRLPGLTA